MAGRRVAPSRPWTVALCAVAGLQILLGLAGLALSASGQVAWQRPTVVRDWQRAAEILAFAGLATHLLRVARHEPRAFHLATLLLLIAVFYAQPAIAALALALPPAGARWVSALAAVPVDAFTPAAAWLFVRDFPRALEWRGSAALVRIVLAACVALGLFLVAANVLAAFVPPHSPLAWTAVFDRSHPWSHYWTAVFTPILPVLPFVLWRTRHAPREERGRVRLFATGIALFGSLPVVYSMLAPALSEFAQGDWVQTVVVPLVLVMLVGFAATTAYSVLVDDVLDVRVVLRKAAQYALARAVAWTLAVAPFAAIATVVYRRRAEPLTTLSQGSQTVWIVVLAIAGAAALQLRRRVMVAVDRMFFREAYDSREILAELTSHARGATSTAHLVDAVTAELDWALHPESIALLVRPADDDELVPLGGGARPLPTSSDLADVLARSARPLRVDFARGPLARLPERDRTWIADAGAAVLVPLVGSGGGIIGLLAIGPKRSQLPFSREDLLLLSAACASAGIALENRSLRESEGLRRATLADEAVGSECIRCGLVDEKPPDGCTTCGGSQRPAALPRRLLGKFEVERRIGAGAMGVVYLARDLDLDRNVALKTLPAAAPEDAGRLRREARAMAAITHPNLAVIHGAETWRGTPVLVIEYLAGGTLEDRMRRGASRPDEAFSLARSMAGALACAHTEGLLHRDVKPSNIGFTGEGEAKLLDFGLARIIGTPGAARPRGDDAGREEMAGTPLYMSPEALAGARPEPGFDLWAMAVVAFEMLAGVHPFERVTASASLAAIQRGWEDGLGRHLSDADPSVLRFFERSLARERRQRPATAEEFSRAIPVPEAGP